MRPWDLETLRPLDQTRPWNPDQVINSQTYLAHLGLVFLCPTPKQKKAAPCIPGILAHNPGRLWPSASKSLNHRHSFIICGKRDASYSPIDARSMRAFWKTDVEYSVVTPWAYREGTFFKKKLMLVVTGLCFLCSKLNLELAHAQGQNAHNWGELELIEGDCCVGLF